MLVTRFRCPHCGQAGKAANPIPLGRKVRCAACSTPFAVAPDRPGPVETFRDDLAEDTSLPQPRRERSYAPQPEVEAAETYRSVRRAPAPRRRPAGDGRATKFVLIGALILVLAGGGVFLIVKGFKGESIFGGNKRVTKENFEKLEAGMTLNEVDAILGSGSKADDDDIRDVFGDRGHDFGSKGPAGDQWLNNGRQADVTQWYHWRNGDFHVFVGFAPTDQGEAAALSFWVRKIKGQGGWGFESGPGILTAGNLNFVVREKEKIARLKDDPRWKVGDRRQLLVGMWRGKGGGYDFTADGTIRNVASEPVGFESSYRFTDDEHVECNQPIHQFPGMAPVPPRLRRYFVLVDQNELYLVDETFRPPSLDGPYHRITMDGNGAGRAKAIDPLIQQLSDRDSQKRQSAAVQLGALASIAAPAVPALIARLWDADENVRGAAVAALGQIGPLAKAAVPEMIRVLRDTRFAQQHNVVMSLGKIGPEAKAAIPDLVEMTRTPGLNPDAEAALNQIDPSGALRLNPGPKLQVPDAGPSPDKPAAPRPNPPAPKPNLPSPPPMPKPSPPDPNSPPPGADEATQLEFWINRLKDPNLSVRIRALDHLSRFGTKAASTIPTLIEFLRTGGIHEKARAATCLGHMGPLAKEAVPALVEVRKAGGIPASFAENALQRIDPNALR